MSALKYENLLSPIRIGRKKVLKNRIATTTSEPPFLNGPGNYPNDRDLQHYRDKAMGAAIVTVTGLVENGLSSRYPDFMPMTQMPDFDIYNRRYANQFTRLTDNIHFYQSLANATLGISMGGFSFEFRGKTYTIPKGSWGRTVMESWSEEELEAYIALDMRQALACKELGFDMVSIHAAYGATPAAESISKGINHRSDKFGDRSYLVKRIAGGIKELCGEDFLVELLLTGDDGPKGNSVADSVALLCDLEGYIDLAQIRGPHMTSHPTGFESETPHLEAAASIKQAGVPMLIATTGGYFYPDTCERVIAEGKADLVTMARSFISNPNYGQLLYEGKGEDIIPCIRCNKCHGGCMGTLSPASDERPLISGCSVNPWVALEADRDKLVMPVASKKRIAVIGGGPGGMKAAMTAADRGHTVTLYEAGNHLGGQLSHADYVSFKWPLRDFKNYLIRQVEKRDNIRVVRNTLVTPEQLAQEGYDVILAGLGSEPVIPPIPGVKEYAVPATKVFGKEQELGKTVVMIGGGEIGVETGMYLGQCGHQVTVLEMKDKMAAESMTVHYRENLECAMAHTPGVTFVTKAKVIAVEPHSVLYEDLETGQKITLPADSILVSAGTRARLEEALAFAKAAPRFALIGEVGAPANDLMHTLYCAEAAASRF